MKDLRMNGCTNTHRLIQREIQTKRKKGDNVVLACRTAKQVKFYMDYTNAVTARQEDEVNGCYTALNTESAFFKAF
jgi:hypothetical protein